MFNDFCNEDYKDQELALTGRNSRAKGDDSMRDDIKGECNLSAERRVLEDEIVENTYGLPSKKTGKNKHSRLKVSKIIDIE